jgi:hypothetical protein
MRKKSGADLFASDKTEQGLMGEPGVRNARFGPDSTGSYLADECDLPNMNRKR